mmetsp:Transcript_43208/g.99617  ORF Transcript_43208/g.99617 Transcript_43208/m.99617 type:complete len:212 (-) Transcript_43208:195-830(-)
MSMLNTTLDAENFGNHLSTHRRSPQYSIGQESRFLQKSRSLTVPGPGHYKVDRDFVIWHEDEMVARNLTGPHGAMQVGTVFPTEPRTTSDGTLKGMAAGLGSKGCGARGPGYYDSHLVQASKTIVYSIPAAKESQEALRERKQFDHSVGPGAYTKQGIFDGIGQERQKALKRLARRHGKACWASEQYNHIFGCMKPITKDASERGSSRSLR